MQHPSERFVKIELLCLGLALFIGGFAIYKTSLLLLFMSIYLIAISLLCDGLVAITTHYRVTGIKQIIRAILLFILTTLIIFNL